MRAPAGSLLEETNRLIVWRQAKYGDKLGVPWGMSESEIRRPRHRADLPVFELRGAGPRLQARSRRQHRHRALRHRPSPPWSIRPRRRATTRGLRGSAPAAPMAGTRRWTIRARVFLTGRRSRWSAPTWPTTRRWPWWASPMRCTTGACASASTPSPSCRRPSCCCRSWAPREVALARPAAGTGGGEQGRDAPPPRDPEALRLRPLAYPAARRSCPTAAIPSC